MDHSVAQVSLQGAFQIPFLALRLGKAVKLLLLFRQRYGAGRRETMRDGAMADDLAAFFGFRSGAPLGVAPVGFDLLLGGH